MKVRNSNTHNSESRANKEVASQWEDTDWTTVYKHVNRLQTRIAKATQERKWYLVKRLQYLLVHSHYAKLLAVRTVTKTMEPERQVLTVRCGVLLLPNLKQQNL